MIGAVLTTKAPRDLSFLQHHPHQQSYLREENRPEEYNLLIEDTRQEIPDTRTPQSDGHPETSLEVQERVPGGLL